VDFRKRRTAGRPSVSVVGGTKNTMHSSGKHTRCSEYGKGQRTRSRQAGIDCGPAGAVVVRANDAGGGANEDARTARGKGRNIVSCDDGAPGVAVVWEANKPATGSRNNVSAFHGKFGNINCAYWNPAIAVVSGSK